MKIENDEERFWSKVDKSGECWIWTAAKTSHNYGYFSYKNRGYPAHRFAYILAYGSIPLGNLVCHKCDNPLCVRPDHLFAGTQSDNMKDMVSKGRGVHPTVVYRGSDSPNARLTENDILEIRRLHKEDKRTYKEIGVQYDIGVSHVGKILSKKVWKHI